jgi:integrase
MKLTPKTIEHLKPRDHRVEIPDAGAVGLYLILQSSGAKSWATRYRFNDKPTKLTLGSWPQLSLHDARVAAAQAREQVAKGIDPAAAKQAAKVETMEVAKNTVANVCARYLALEGKKLRTASQRERIFRDLVYPAIGERPIDSVKRSEIATMLDKIEVRNGPRMADVTLATLRRAFHWYEKRSDEFRSPIIRGMSRQNTAEHRRTRILDDRELRAVWQATEDKSPFSALVRFLLLTSARRHEAAAMKSDEVVDGVWTLPASRSKTKTEIARPLSRAALAILDGLPHIDGCPYPFTSNGITPIASFSEPKRKLDLASGTSGWRLHDLRRTARSLLSRAGINSDVAEKCLGHSRGDIIERYDQHKYIDEMQRALEALAALVERIVNPPAGDVADMAAERSKRRR